MAYSKPEKHWLLRTDHVITSCLSAGKEILGETVKKKKHEDHILEVI